MKNIPRNVRFNEKNPMTPEPGKRRNNPANNRSMQVSAAQPYQNMLDPEFSESEDEQSMDSHSNSLFMDKRDLHIGRIIDLKEEVFAEYMKSNEALHHGNDIKKGPAVRYDYSTNYSSLFKSITKKSEQARSVERNSVSFSKCPLSADPKNLEQMKKTRRRFTVATNKGMVGLQGVAQYPHSGPGYEPSTAGYSSMYGNDDDASELSEEEDYIMPIPDSYLEKQELAYKLASVLEKEEKFSKDKILKRWILTLEVPQKRGFKLVKGKKEGLTVRKMTK